jgi:tetratricopeptide (TPR) repeat protein
VQTEPRPIPETTAARRRRLAAGLADASRLLKQGQAEAAIEHCHALRTSWPDSADVLRYLGLGCLQAGRLSEAERHFLGAMHQEPASPNLKNDLGIVYLRQKAYGDAQKYFEGALDIDPNHGDALSNIAVLFTELNQPERARPYLQRLVAVLPFSGAAYAKAARNSLLLDHVEVAIRLGRKAVRFAPELSDARLSLAEALETSGRFRQAKFQYLSVLRVNPRHAAALAKLLSMRQTRIDTRFASEARAVLESGNLSGAERAQLHLALARYHDQREDYDSAFAHLTRGNSITWKKQAFDSSLYSRAVDAILAVFTPEFFSSQPRHEVRSTRPIFIVGMPRSGTTLVEQILASHPRVAAGGELSTITNLAGETGRAGEAYPDGIRILGGAGLAKMARRYLGKLETVSPDAPHVTDKMPFNFMHLGLIATLFPDAAIVHCRRGALDTCLSCYFTSFSDNLLFASNQEALGHYYLDYRRMMDHWRRVLPKPMLDVEYEQLVGNTEKTVSAMLTYCRLEWEPACLQFHRTDRGIRTPSRWQVRQPIYSRSVGRWRRYERHLQPLLDVLAPVVQGDAGMPPERS